MTIWVGMAFGRCSGPPPTQGSGLSCRSQVEARLRSNHRTGWSLAAIAGEPPGYGRPLTVGVGKPQDLCRTEAIDRRQLIANPQHVSRCCRAKTSFPAGGVSVQFWTPTPAARAQRGGFNLMKVNAKQEHPLFNTAPDQRPLDCKHSKAHTFKEKWEGETMHICVSSMHRR